MSNEAILFVFHNDSKKGEKRILVFAPMSLLAPPSISRSKSPRPKSTTPLRSQSRAIVPYTSGRMLEDERRSGLVTIEMAGG